MRTVLFICTGNTCRSPLAEAIARHDLERHGPGSPLHDIFVASAGISTTPGSPITPEAMKALERLGIEHSGASKPLTANMIRNADLVLCMTEAQVDAARRLVAGSPEHIAKIMMLDPGSDIEDPIGTGQGVYDALARKLMRIVPRRLKEVLANEDRARL